MAEAVGKTRNNALVPGSRCKLSTVPTIRAVRGFCPCCDPLSSIRRSEKRPAELFWRSEFQADSSMMLSPKSATTRRLPPSAAM